MNTSDFIKQVLERVESISKYDIKTLEEHEELIRKGITAYASDIDDTTETEDRYQTFTCLTQLNFFLLCVQSQIQYLEPQCRNVIKVDFT